MQKDLWNVNSIDKAKIEHLLSSIQGSIQQIRKDIAVESILLDMDWQDMSDSVDSLFDELHILELRQDNDRRCAEERRKIIERHGECVKF